MYLHISDKIGKVGCGVKKKIIIIFLCVAVIILASNYITYLNDHYGRVGIASWYGNDWRGRRTASGETFNPDKLTAAHRILQFGTLVKVINLANDKIVVVRINDRGPYKKGRIIDLSLSAARRLDMVEDGLTKVKIEILSKEKTE